MKGGGENDTFRLGKIQDKTQQTSINLMQIVCIRVFFPPFGLFTGYAWTWNILLWILYVKIDQTKYSVTINQPM